MTSRIVVTLDECGTGCGRSNGIAPSTVFRKLRAYTSVDGNIRHDAILAASYSSKQVKIWMYDFERESESIFVMARAVCYFLAKMGLEATRS